MNNEEKIGAANLIRRLAKERREKEARGEKIPEVPFTNAEKIGAAKIIRNLHTMQPEVLASGKRARAGAVKSDDTPMHREPHVPPAGPAGSGPVIEARAAERQARREAAEARVAAAWQRVADAKKELAEAKAEKAARRARAKEEHVAQATAKRAEYIRKHKEDREKWRSRFSKKTETTEVAARDAVPSLNNKPWTTEELLAMKAEDEAREVARAEAKKNKKLITKIREAFSSTTPVHDATRSGTKLSMGVAGAVDAFNAKAEQDAARKAALREVLQQIQAGQETERLAPRGMRIMPPPSPQGEKLRELEAAGIQAAKAAAREREREIAKEAPAVPAEPHDPDAPITRFKSFDDPDNPGMLPKREFTGIFNPYRWYRAIVDRRGDSAVPEFTTGTAASTSDILPDKNGYYFPAQSRESGAGRTDIGPEEPVVRKDYSRHRENATMRRWRDDAENRATRKLVESWEDDHEATAEPKPSEEALRRGEKIMWELDRAKESEEARAGQKISEERADLARNTMAYRADVERRLRERRQKGEKAERIARRNEEAQSPGGGRPDFLDELLATNPDIRPERLRKDSVESAALNVQRSETTKEDVQSSLVGDAQKIERSLEDFHETVEAIENRRLEREAEFPPPPNFKPGWLEKIADSWNRPGEKRSFMDAVNSDFGYLYDWVVDPHVNQDVRKQAAMQALDEWAKSVGWKELRKRMKTKNGSAPVIARAKVIARGMGETQG